MGKTIRLTESELIRLVKKTIKEDYFNPDLRGVTKGNEAGYKQVVKTYATITDFGSGLFKKGEYEVDENNPKIIELLQKLQKSGAKEVIVSASASNTGWGPNPAGSPEAVKKNKELSQKRMNSMANLIKKKYPSIKVIMGTPSVGIPNSPNPEKDQSITLSPKNVGKTVETGATAITVDRDSTSRVDPYKRVQLSHVEARICTRVPLNHAKELMKMIREFGDENKIPNIKISKKEIDPNKNKFSLY